MNNMYDLKDAFKGSKKVMILFFHNYYCDLSLETIAVCNYIIPSAAIKKIPFRSSIPS